MGHGANGYLIDQFLYETSNKRETGRYAGTTLETRSQFLKDVLANVTEEVGSDRVGLRISPLNSYQDMNRGGKAVEEVKYIASVANDFDLAYLHVMRGDFFWHPEGGCCYTRSGSLQEHARCEHGIRCEGSSGRIAAGSFDVVAFGTTFLANPDLPARIKKGAELNAPKPDLFYKGEAKGYTDYPFLELNDEEKKEA